MTLKYGDLVGQAGPGPHPVLYCAGCHAESSAHAGDYLARDPNAPVVCTCGEPLRRVNRTVLWIAEFGAEYAVPALVTDTLEDLSWHNDICPSFTTKGIAANDPTYHEGVDVRLWVDHPDPQERETGPDTPRFRVTGFFGADFIVYETDTDLPEAIAVLEREAAKYTQPVSERRHRRHVADT